MSDLAVGNFPGNGIAGAGARQTRIQRCHLGTNPGGTIRAPNGLRGAQIEGGVITVTDSLLAGNFRSGGWFESDNNVSISRNRFVENGASGLYAKTTLAPPGRFASVSVNGNEISRNAHAGISLDRASNGNFAGNEFHDNLGRAIDIGIDGPTLAMVPGLPGREGTVGVPVITSVRYDNGQTTIEARIAPRSPWNTYLGEAVYFYASPVPRDGGELLGFVDAVTVRGSETFTLVVPRDLRGQWVSAATFAVYIYNWDDAAPATSEVGVPRLVE